MVDRAFIDGKRALIAHLEKDDLMTAPLPNPFLGLNAPATRKPTIKRKPIKRK
jgi:hypothetical protein